MHKIPDFETDCAWTHPAHFVCTPVFATLWLKTTSRRMLALLA